LCPMMSMMWITHSSLGSFIKKQGR
jgi:hypothetical protein